MQELDIIDKLQFICKHLNLTYYGRRVGYTLHTPIINPTEKIEYMGNFTEKDIDRLYRYLYDFIEYSNMIIDTEQEREKHFEKVTLGKMNIDNQLNKHAINPFKYKMVSVQTFKVVKVNE